MSTRRRSLAMGARENRPPQPISLLDQINDDVQQSALMDAMLKAVPELERKHTVSITKVAVCWAVYLTHRHFSQTYSGCELEEKCIYILNSGCLLLRSEIDNHIDEKRIDELEHILSRCMVEAAELLKENPNCKQWLPRVYKEYKEATTALTKFITTWKPILKKSLDRHCTVFPYIEELFQKHFVALPLCVSSACQTGKFSDCYSELQKLDATAAKIEKILPVKCFLEEVMALKRCHIGEVVSRMIGIPLPLLPTYGSLELSNLADRLHERVVDLDDAINDIYKSIFTNAPLHPNREKRPRASLLFLGPSGVGKTEVAKCIAEVFFGTADRLVVVDMSKYGELHQESGFQWLAETISKKPHSLILFEKIEKSHLNAMGNLLLDLICGKLCDKDGRSVNLSNVIVIMTSHAEAEKLTSLCTCSDAFKRQVDSFPGSIDRMHECSIKTSAKEHVLEKANTIFGPVMLNSLDGTIVFDTFGLGVENVTRHIMRKSARAISSDKLVLYPSNHMLDVVSNNYFNQLGKDAKAIKSWLEENLMPLLRGIVEDMANKHCTVYIDTLVGTEELSFRLDKTDFPEKWVVDHFQLSFRKFRALYQMDKALVHGILQLRNCLSLFLNPIGDSQLKSQKHFVDTTMLVIEICSKMLHSGWLLDLDKTKKVLYSEVCKNTILNSRCAQKEYCSRQELRARLLPLRGTIQNQAVNMILNAVLESIDSSLDHLKKCPKSFLLMGLANLGRTEFVKNLIDHFKLINEGRSLLFQVDLSNYKDSQSLLFATSQRSKGYASSILAAVRSCPYSVLLFCHIEKADASVFGTLLKILDTGILHDDQNSMVDFRSTTIIVMTELGNTDMMARFLGCSDPTSFQEIDAREGVKHFRSELVYRMDEIVFVAPLAQEQMHLVRLPMKERVLQGADIRGTRKFIYNIFEDYTALPVNLDFLKIEV